MDRNPQGTSTESSGVREAVGYIRVSRKEQAEGHSPDVQRDEVRRLAKEKGYLIPSDLLFEDHERGHKVTRRHYQEALAAIRSGRGKALFVFTLSRLGRRAPERIRIAEELDKLGVPIFSVREGQDKPGIMRYLLAGVDEEFSRTLAFNVSTNRCKGAQEGTHMGPTPFGYKRLYPEWDGKGKRPHGRLVPDEATAPIVRDLFTRYASGGWSLNKLTRWLNTEYPALAPNRTSWHSSTVYGILVNVTYRGEVGFGKRPQGYYVKGNRDEAFTSDGKHEAIISPDLFAEVQRRLAAAEKVPSYNRMATIAGRPVALGTGIFRCAVCHGPMTYVAHSAQAGRGPQYLCRGRMNGSLCTGRGYHADRAHVALLAEIGRLRGIPWREEAEQFLINPTGPDEATKRVGITRALEDAKALMREHMRKLVLVDEDNIEAVRAYNEVTGEISLRIKSLENQVHELSARVDVLPDLKTMHDRLMQTELPEFIAEAQQDGDLQSVRDTVLLLVSSAHLVDRQPAINSKWLRFEVEWAPAIMMLLEAGLLRLEPVPGAPSWPTRLEQRQAQQRQRRARMRAERQKRQSGAVRAEAQRTHSTRFLVLSRTVRITSCCNSPISSISRLATS